tara:strand:- start:7155 stop:7796 length:642 start_codon:yes stop_codon:yes gene_type:complete
MNMLKGKVVIMNCPPNAGKDTITASLCQVTGAAHAEFKDQLYKCTAALFNYPLEAFKELSTGRSTKELPCEDLGLPYENFCRLCDITGTEYPESRGKIYLSPREALIYTSEILMKPNFGQDYFGKAAAKNVNKQFGSVFSDGGFNEELKPLIEEFGASNIFIVQFTRGDNVSFEGDSRNWLEIPEGVNCLRTGNNSTVAYLRDEIINWIREVV